MHPSDLQSQSDCPKLREVHVPATILHERQSFCSALIRMDYSHQFPLTSNVLLSYAVAGPLTFAFSGNVDLPTKAALLEIIGNGLHTLSQEGYLQ